MPPLSVTRGFRLEQAFADDVGDHRFLPYLQLHEFEALLLSDPVKFEERFNENKEGVQVLLALSLQYDSPEYIDDGKDTSPSKRIIKAIPEYEGAKVSAGPLIAQKIGLVIMRQKCRHFDEWLSKLERLDTTTISL